MKFLSNNITRTILVLVLCFYTVKKISFIPNPPKRFGRFENGSKCVESSKNRINKHTEPLKDLTVCPQSDPFFFETFLRFRRAKERFRRKIRNFKSFGLNSNGFIRNPLQNHEIKYETFEVSYLPTKPFFCSTEPKKGFEEKRI